MHQTTRNELRLDISLTPLSPLSIQARGSHRFVRAIHPFVGESSIYIPASTLKGTLRNSAEQVFQSVNVPCCDPQHPCVSGDHPDLRKLCPVCRLFGNRSIRSHVTVTDSFPLDPIDKLSSRDQDRKHRKLPDETAIDQTFYGTIGIRNFERWQAGLLSLILARINLADVQMGSNRALGMGQIAVRFRCLSLIYFGFEIGAKQQEFFRTRLHGVGQLAGQNSGYTYPDVADGPDLPDLATVQTGPGYAAVMVTTDDQDEAHDLIDNVLTRQALAWSNFVRSQRSR